MKQVGYLKFPEPTFLVGPYDGPSFMEFVGSLQKEVLVVQDSSIATSGVFCTTVLGNVGLGFRALTIRIGVWGILVTIIIQSTPKPYSNL